jgi:uncharacterized protein (TIGR00297 family)
MALPREPAYAAWAVLLATCLSVRGHRRGSLSRSGAALAFVVGLVSCAASVRFGLTLIAFFLSSSKMTRVGAARKRKLEEGHTVGGNRNWVQVAANGGLGTALAAAFYRATRGAGLHPELPVDIGAQPAASLLQVAYLCHYAACNADTWASELGVLSRAKPRLVTTLRVVPAGTNGGVSALGTAASVGGGLAIGLVFWAVGAAAAAAPPLLEGGAAAGGGGAAPAQWPLIPLGAAAGGVGSLVDSLLGATLQYSAWCDEQKLVVETPRATAKRICGRHVLDNHQVNFLAAAITSALGAALVARSAAFR